MALLGWVMMGIAIWHFAVWLPDRFWGGIVGAFVGAVIGSVLTGLLFSGFDLPSQADTTILTILEAIPGCLLGMGVIWLIGLQQEKAEHARSGAGSADAFGRPAA